MVAKQFYHGITIKDVSKGAHIIKHSHVVRVEGSFDEILHERYIWNVHINVLSFILHKYVFFTLNTMVQSFMEDI